MTDIILSLDKEPDNEYVCFLPFRGEFGWYIHTFVKRFHGYNHSKKIACIKHGHECLFPTAHGFFYTWDDIPDDKKAGIAIVEDEDQIKDAVIKRFGTEDIHFVSPMEAGWEEKTSLAKYSFIPTPRFQHDIQADVVLCARQRALDPKRNMPNRFWKDVCKFLKSDGLTLASCGRSETSKDLNVSYRAYDYVDVDTDVELMLKSKLIITQESGLLFLAFMCEKPVIVVDNYLDWISEHHRVNRDVYLYHMGKKERYAINTYNKAMEYLR